MRPGVPVDHRCRGNANLWHDLVAMAAIAGGFTGAKQRYLPELSAGIGVERVYGIVFGHDENNVVHPPAIDS